MALKRSISMQTSINKYAEGSCLIELGDTKILCTASIDRKVPGFKKNTNSGWLSAEYSLLPRSTSERNTREATKGKQNGRTIEIQRLISRSLRASIDLSLLGERTIYVDCDVLQADGGTRTAAITGGCVAVAQACKFLVDNKIVAKNPFKNFVTAISAGIVNDKILVDLDYKLDFNAETDMNIVRLENGEFIEIQGTAEKNSFSKNQLINILDSCSKVLDDILILQKKVSGYE